MNRGLGAVGSVVPWVLGAAASAAPVVVTAGSSQVAPGQEVKIPIGVKGEVKIPIGVKGVAGLGALELRLTYDPAVLEVTRVERGAVAADAGVMDFSAGPDGRVGMGFASTAPVSGDGVVLTVLARVTGATGQQSPLRLEAVRGWDGANVTDVLVTAEDGEFMVIPTRLALPFPW